MHILCAHDFDIQHIGKQVLLYHGRINYTVECGHVSKVSVCNESMFTQHPARSGRRCMDELQPLHILDSLLDSLQSQRTTRHSSFCIH